MSSYYVTTPIYYVNDLPHIGHIYTTVVTDTVARYRRMAGDQVYFLTGTDEHGQNIERAAAREGIEPIQLGDRVVERYHQLWRQMDMSHDDFIRTSEERHHRGVTEIIRRLTANGDLYLDRHEGWYCSSCETFYTEKELGDGDEKRCPVHETPAEWTAEENVFFRLSKYQEPLLELYRREGTPFIRPETRANEVRAFVESGLKDLSVSRTKVRWGVPFPDHDGHTVYVWLDALTNYISALGFGGADTALYETFWADPESTRVHLVGKDILRFHSVYWPAFLMSAGLPLPTTVWAHGWWLRDERKISKSVGNLVRPDELMERFGPDCLRYFLLREMSFGQDASFSDEAFVDRYNAELANELGNAVSRVVTLSRRAFDGCTPPVPCDDNPLRNAAAEAVAVYRREMDDYAFHRGLDGLWHLLREVNGYIQDRRPWELMKDPDAKDRLSRILWNALEALRIVAVGLLPVMPQIAPRVLAALAAPVPDRLDAMSWGGTTCGIELEKTPALFPRVDKKAFFAAEASAKAGGEAKDKAPKKAAKKAKDGVITIDQFFETVLKVGRVTAAERVPKSDKLLQLTVEVGEETRTIVAGIAQQYEPEAVVGRLVVVVANLKPAKLMGVESQGMVLAATVDGKPVLVQPSEEVPTGVRVR